MTTITALPPAPSTLDPTTFDTKADALIAAWPTFITETNTVAGEVIANRDTAIAQVGLAAAQVTLAQAEVVLAHTEALDSEASAVLSDASRVTAQSTANFKGLWINVTGVANIPYCVFHLGIYWQLASNLADVTTKTPGTDVEWIPASPPPSASATMYAYQNFGGF